MMKIRPSSDLRNRYKEISSFCHQYSEPVYITKNGEGDLVVMSVDAYEKLIGKLSLYQLLEEGIESMKNGELFSIDDVFKTLETNLTK